MRKGISGSENSIRLSVRVTRPAAIDGYGTRKYARASLNVLSFPPRPLQLSAFSIVRLALARPLVNLLCQLNYFEFSNASCEMILAQWSKLFRSDKFTIDLLSSDFIACREQKSQGGSFTGDT